LNFTLWGTFILTIAGVESKFKFKSTYKTSEQGHKEDRFKEKQSFSQEGSYCNVALAEWSRAPDWELRCKVTGSNANHASNF